MTDGNKPETAKKRSLGRSPSYPTLSISEALSKVQALRAAEGDYAAPLPSVFKALGYGEKSSGGRQTLATLRYYGLVDVIGEGDGRKVKVSDIARRILLDQREDDSERRRLIREVALAPAAHKALLEEYPNGLGSDGTVQHHLIFNLEFNPDAAKELLEEFKATADFIGLYQSPLPLDKEPRIDKGKAPVQIRVGSRIQWTSGGVDQFREPATVLGISDDGNWVFTDQGKAAAPLKEVTLVEPVPDEVTPPEMPARLQQLLKGSRGVAEEAPRGTEVLTSGKLKSGSFEVRVTGEVTAADIRRIRKMLQAQEDILADDEDVDPSEI